MKLYHQIFIIRLKLIIKNYKIFKMSFIIYFNFFLNLLQFTIFNFLKL
jgi:hypothetical protein